jgi:hypothetical protein
MSGAHGLDVTNGIKISARKRLLDTACEATIQNVHRLPLNLFLAGVEVTRLKYFLRKEIRVSSPRLLRFKGSKRENIFGEFSPYCALAD